MANLRSAELLLKENGDVQMIRRAETQRIILQHLISAMHWISLILNKIVNPDNLNFKIKIKELDNEDLKIYCRRNKQR